MLKDQVWKIISFSIPADQKNVYSFFQAGKRSNLFPYFFRLRMNPALRAACHFRK